MTADRASECSPTAWLRLGVSETAVVTGEASPLLYWPFPDFRCARCSGLLVSATGRRTASSTSTRPTSWRRCLESGDGQSWKHMENC